MPKPVALASSAMTQETIMSESEAFHTGSKRRNLCMENCGDISEDVQGYSGDEKVVQTTKSKGIVNVQLFIRSKFPRDSYVTGIPAMPSPAN
jgi:hypothetical protein